MVSSVPLYMKGRRVTVAPRLAYIRKNAAPKAMMRAIHYATRMALTTRDGRLSGSQLANIILSQALVAHSQGGMSAKPIHAAIDRLWNHAANLIGHDVAWLGQVHDQILDVECETGAHAPISTSVYMCKGIDSRVADVSPGCALPCTLVDCTDMESLYWQHAAQATMQSSSGVGASQINSSRHGIPLDNVELDCDADTSQCASFNASYSFFDENPAEKRGSAGFSLKNVSVQCDMYNGALQSLQQRLHQAETELSRQQQVAGLSRLHSDSNSSDNSEDSSCASTPWTSQTFDGSSAMVFDDSFSGLASNSHNLDSLPRDECALASPHAAPSQLEGVPSLSMMTVDIGSPLRVEIGTGNQADGAQPGEDKFCERFLSTDAKLGESWVMLSPSSQSQPMAHSDSAQSFMTTRSL